MPHKIWLSIIFSLSLAACGQASDTGGEAGSTPAEGQNATVDVDIPYDKFVLDNGLTVIVHEDRKAPIVNVSIWYHVGSKDERPGKTGFAHLFEHLMFNGSENWDDEYFGPFEKVGATSINGTTWFDRTNYFQNVPTPALDMALWMESDRMGHLLGAITQQKLDEQRGVVQNEKRQGDSQPYGLTKYRLLEGLFPEGHPYRWTTIGSMEDLNAASLEDVKEWFREYYGTANAVLVIAGDVDAETGHALAIKYFGDIPSGPPLKQYRSWIPDRTENTREIMYDRVPQTRIYRTWAVPGRTYQDRTILSVAASILGSGKNSRLYQALVYESQLATSVRVSVEPHELTSMFKIEATLKVGSDADEVLTIIDKVMAEFLTNGPTEEELFRAKSKVTASVVRGLEQIGGFGGKATILAQGELYSGDPGFYKTAFGWVNGADVASVRDAARVWLADGYYQLTVFPFEDYATVETDADRSRLPDVGAMPSLSFPEIKTATLDNGIEVILAERRTIPVINITMQFDAGYAADMGGALGTSSFTLAMLDEGTTTRTALEISAEAEGLGAIISTSSNLDVSTVSLSALKSNMDASMALYADVLRNAAFTQQEIDRLRQQWLARIQQEKAQPIGLALRNLPPLLYGAGHAYGMPLTGSGTEESITGLTRDDLIQFQSDWLRPDNAQIFVVGDTSLDEILPILNQAFGDWQAPPTTIPSKNISEVDLPDEARVIIFDRPGSPQSMIVAGHLVPSTGDADTLAIETMNDILGGQFTARINMNLREDKGWSYGAFTFIPDARGQRPLIVFAPVQTDKTKESLMELMKEFEGYLGENPAREDELTKVVNSNVLSLPGQFETARAVMGSLLDNARFGRDFEYVTTLKDRYEALSLDHIHEAAAEHFAPGQLVWLIIGDRAEIEAGIRELNLGTLEKWDADGNIIGP